MAARDLSAAQVLALLAESPQHLRVLTAGLTAEQLRHAPAEADWSALAVLAHLRACADVWGEGIATILREDKPTIHAVNPRTWIQQTDYLALDFLRSLRAYRAQRTRLLALLQPLTPHGWARSATVKGAGAPVQWTVLFYARRLARHERTHLAQMRRIVRAVRES